jgi:hypothetical protein
MDRKQALEFAAVLLAAMQKTEPTIRVWVKCTQPSKTGQAAVPGEMKSST